MQLMWDVYEKVKLKRSAPTHSLDMGQLADFLSSPVFKDSDLPVEGIAADYARSPPEPPQTTLQQCVTCVIMRTEWIRDVDRLKLLFRCFKEKKSPRISNERLQSMVSALVACAKVLRHDWQDLQQSLGFMIDLLRRENKNGPTEELWVNKALNCLSLFRLAAGENVESNLLPQLQHVWRTRHFPHAVVCGVSNSHVGVGREVQVCQYCSLLVLKQHAAQAMDNTDHPCVSVCVSEYKPGTVRSRPAHRRYGSEGCAIATPANMYRAVFAHSACASAPSPQQTPQHHWTPYSSKRRCGHCMAWLKSKSNMGSRCSWCNICVHETCKVGPAARLDLSPPARSPCLVPLALALARAHAPHLPSAAHSYCTRRTAPWGTSNRRLSPQAASSDAETCPTSRSKR